MPTPHYGQPRYRAIADELRKRIESGAIPPGALLPAESVLTVEFRAARGTIRQAIEVLRETGLVSTEHGRGTYANPGRPDRAPDKPSELERRHRQTAADQELATLFAVKEGTMLVEQQVVTRVDGIVQEVARKYRLLPSEE